MNTKLECAISWVNFTIDSKKLAHCKNLFKSLNPAIIMQVISYKRRPHRQLTMIQDLGNICSCFLLIRLSVLVRFASDLTSTTNIESNTTFTVLNEVRWW